MDTNVRCQTTHDYKMKLILENRSLADILYFTLLKSSEKQCREITNLVLMLHEFKCWSLIEWAQNWAEGIK